MGLRVTLRREEAPLLLDDRSESASRLPIVAEEAKSGSKLTEAASNRFPGEAVPEAVEAVPEAALIPAGVEPADRRDSSAKTRSSPTAWFPFPAAVTEL